MALGPDYRPVDVDVTPATAPTKLRGLDLLDLAIHQIELTPTSWDQSEWRCGTGMCLAGWTATLAGGTWADSPTSSWAPYLEVDEDDDPNAIEELDPGHPVIHVRDRAQALLGLDTAEACELFNGYNDLTYIKKVRDWLADPSGESPWRPVGDLEAVVAEMSERIHALRHRHDRD